MRTQEERNKLVIDHQPLVSWVCRVFGVVGNDDAASEAQLALLMAAEKWPGGNFEHYAKLCLYRHVKRFLGEEAKEVVVGQYPDIAVELDLDTRQDVDAALARLPNDLGAVLRKIYFDGKTESEVAAEHGYSQQHVSKLKQRALSEMKQLLPNQN